MVYLIGGVLKSGKSYLAEKIKEEKKASIFETDFLLWGLGGRDGLFNYGDDDKKVSEILEPYLLKIISYLIENDIDYVIDGTHITLELYGKINEIYPSKTRIVMLGYSNEIKDNKYEQIISHLNEIKDKWFLTLSKEDFIILLDKKIKESASLKKRCKELKIPYYNVMDISKEYKDIIDTLFDIGM